jgi:DNA-binding response OmpR family regulator
LADVLRSRVIGPMVKSAQSVVTVLLVEDETKLRASLAEGLRLEEWTVVAAASGNEARQQLDAQRFDLIILDWMLPDCDGLEIVRHLRAKGDSTPVLMITARAGMSAEVIVRQAGATDYLAKPFSFTDLLDRSRGLLAARP